MNHRESMEKRLYVAVSKFLTNSVNLTRWENTKTEQNEIAKTLNRLRIESPNNFIPLRLACSVYLSYGSKNCRIKFPVTYNDFQRAWQEINTLPGQCSAINQLNFKEWLNRQGNYRFASISAKRFCSNMNMAGIGEMIKEYDTCNSYSEYLQFWMKFEGVGIQYAKNLCMDEQIPAFENSIKIDSKINKYFDNFPEQSLSPAKKEQLLLRVANQIGLTGWEMDRLCYNYADEIIGLM